MRTYKVTSTPLVPPEGIFRLDIYFDLVIDVTTPMMALKATQLLKDDLLNVVINSKVKEYIMVMTTIDPIHGTDEERRRYNAARIKMVALYEFKNELKTISNFKPEVEDEQHPE